MGNQQFKDDPQDVEEGKKTLVKDYCKKNASGKYGPNGCLRLLADAVGPIRLLGKRAIELRRIAGMDLGGANKDYALYLDDNKFKLSDATGIQDMGPGVFHLKELDLSKNNIKDLKFTKRNKKGELLEQYHLLHKLVNLKKLWICHNELAIADFNHTPFVYSDGDSDIQCVSFQKLRLLSLGYNPRLKMVRLQLDGLKVLELSKCSLMAIPDLTGVPQLRVLIIRDNKTRGRKIDSIADCPLMEVLDLQNNHINWQIKPITDVEDNLPPLEEATGHIERQRAVRKREIESSKDKFRVFMSALASLQILTQLTMLGNKLEEQPFFTYWLFKYQTTIECLNMKEINRDLNLAKPTDKIWLEDKYYVIPGPRFRELRIEEQRQEKQRKRVQESRQIIQNDFNDLKAHGLLPGDKLPLEDEDEDEKAAPAAAAPATEDAAGEEAEVDTKKDGDEAVDEEEAIKYQFCTFKISDLTRMLTRLDVNRKSKYVLDFEMMVSSIIHHPDRPRALLRGDSTKEEDIAEFVDTAILQLQNLYACPPDPEPEDPVDREPGELPPDVNEEEVDTVVSPDECSKIVMRALVDLVAIEEEQFGEACGRALVRLAGGSLKDMGLQLAPLLVRSLGNYMKSDVRKAGYADMPFFDTWHVPQIRNYVIAVDQIMAEVPDTKVYVREIASMLVEWIKDSPLARHMAKYNLLATGVMSEEPKNEDEDEEEAESAPARVDPSLMDVTIRSMEDVENFNASMMRLCLAAAEMEDLVKRYLVKEQVPMRINNLLEMCGLFQDKFWKEYMDAWLEEGGVSGLNEPPTTVQHMLEMVRKLAGDYPMYAQMFSGMEWPMHVMLLKQLHNFDQLMETEPRLMRDPVGGSPRSVMAALMINTVGSLCQWKDYFYDITALEKRSDQLNSFPNFDISINTLYRIFRSSIATCEDADILQALYNFFARMLETADTIEGDLVDEREKELIKQGYDFKHDAVSRAEARCQMLDERKTIDGKDVTMTKLMIRQVDEGENAFTLLQARSDLNEPDLYIVVGRHFLFFKREADTGDVVYDNKDLDRHIINACRVRWAITCQIFELDADQGLEPEAKRKREEDMAMQSKNEAKANIQQKAGSSTMFDPAIVNLYRPRVDRILSLLTGFEKDDQPMHMNYEKLAKEAKRIQLESKRWKVKRLTEDATKLLDVLGKEGVDLLLDKAEELTDEEAILHDSMLPGVTEQSKNSTMCELFQAVLELIAYYLRLSQEHQNLISENIALQDPYVLVQRALRFPLMDKQGETTDLEDVLFQCLRCPNDNVKVAAVECLGRIRTEKLKNDDIAQMVQVVVECDDVSEGRMEDVIGGVMGNLQRIGDMYKLPDATPATCAKAYRFHDVHGNQLINAALTTLTRVAKNDSKFLSPTDKIEKAQLCNTCVEFLSSATEWNQTLADLAASEECSSMVREIFHFEEKWGDPLNPIKIEDTKCVAHSVEYVLGFMRPPHKTSNINTRLLHQIAVMFEGEASAVHNLTADLDREEETDRREEMYAVLGIAGSTDVMEVSSTESRFHEEKYHTDTFHRVFPLGGDEDVEKEGTGGPFTTFQQTNEQQMQLQRTYKEVDLNGAMMDQLFVVLTIDVEQESFELKNGELPNATNFKMIHKQAIDVDETWDELTVKEILDHGKRVIKDTDVGLCVEIPKPLPEKFLAVAPEMDDRGKKIGDEGIYAMMRPIQCCAKIKEFRTKSPHYAGLQGGRDGERCSCWKGATASAALRVLQSIMSYGNNKARKAIWNRLEELDEYSQFILVAYQFGYFQFNIGIKVLRIVKQFLADDNVMPKGVDITEKAPATLKHYWIAILALQDMLREVSFKFTFNCSEIGSGLFSKYERTKVWYEYLRDVVKGCPDPNDKNGMATLAPREEELFLAVVELYDMLVQQFPQLDIQWKKPSDEPTYDEEEEDDPEAAEIARCAEDADNRTNIFPNLFLMGDLPSMMQYIYYNQACQRHMWGVEKKSRERRAKIIEHILSLMSTMYLCNDMEKRYDILSMFYTFEFNEDPDLNKLDHKNRIEYTTGFMQDFLQMTRHRKYMRALTDYIIKNQWNRSRTGKLNPDEYVVDAVWVLMKIPSRTFHRRVLLVFTNRKFYRFEEPLGLESHQDRNTPELMCPGGPDFSFDYEYDQVGQLYRGVDGSGFRLVYFKDSSKTMTINDNYIVYNHGALDRILALIIQFCPHGQSFPRMVCDQWTVELIHSFFPAPVENDSESDKKDQRKPETIEMCYSFEECVIMDTTYKLVMVVLSTHQKLYFFHTNYTYWMCDDEENNVKFLEKIPGLEAPLPVNSEWRCFPRVSSNDEPLQRTAIEIRERSQGGGKKASKVGKLVFMAHFDTYLVCQTFFQGITQARVLACGKSSQANLDDMLG